MPTETLRPNAAGDKTEWTLSWPHPNHWSSVDETPPNEDTDYVEIVAAEGGEKRDLFNLPASSIPDGSTINKITVYFRHRGTLFTDWRCAALIKTNGTEYRAGYTENGTTYQTFSQIWSKNPFTGEDWTRDEINALQIGVAGTRGSWYDEDSGWTYYDNTRCTQVYVEIDYTEAAITKKVLMDGFIFIEG